MSNPLDAIRSELQALRPRVERLERAESLLIPSYDPPEARAKPRAKPNPSRKPRRRNPTQEQVLTFVVEHGPAVRNDVVKGTGGHPKAIGTALRRLLEAGKIVAEGQAPGRRYRAPDRRAEVAQLAGGDGPPPPPGPPPRSTYPVYDAIVELGGATSTQLIERTGMTRREVVHEGRRLARLGWVRLTNSGSEHRWVAVDAIGSAA